MPVKSKYIVQTTSHVLSPIL